MHKYHPILGTGFDDGTVEGADASNETIGSETKDAPASKLKRLLGVASPIGKPPEPSRRCPNCGELNWESNLRHSSQHEIEVENGYFCSTLYGVCKKCAEAHRNT